MLRYRIRITASVDKELYERLKALSKATRVPVSRLIDMGIELVLERKESHQD